MADKSTPNPLEDLYTDMTNQISPIELSSLLKPYVRINRESKKPIFTPMGLELAVKYKLLLLILSRKALFLLEDIASELVAPKDIKNLVDGGIPENTVDVTIKRLSDNGFLRKDQGKYFVPDFNFPQVKKMFKKIER